MTTKFTAGPWIYEKETERVFAPRRKHVCWMKPSSFESEQVIADGNLIAAAPEMYKALKFIADREDFTFAECSLAEEIVLCAKLALAIADGGAQ